MQAAVPGVGSIRADHSKRAAEPLARTERREARAPAMHVRKIEPCLLS